MTDITALAAMMEAELASLGLRIGHVPIPNPPVAHCATFPTPPSAITPSGGDFLEDA